MRVRVRLGASEAHDVIVGRGLLGDLGALVAQHAPAHRCVVIADDVVAAHYADDAMTALHGSGFEPTLLTFPAGEASKTREQWARLTDLMLDDGCGRDTTVVALGGGVTGDLAGFVAAAFMRGVPLVQVPTSLLAMVDAAIGGKTAVDVPAGKNLVGAFHAPAVVIVDPDLLRTLPTVELRQGLAEAVKHGAISDAAHLDWIEFAAGPLLSADADALDELVRFSIQTKARIVSDDPWERAERATLNAGHTIAHALERCTRFSIPHGDAVAIGLVVEAVAGEAAAITEPGTAQRLAAVLATVGLPTRPPAIPAASVLEATRSDKKGRGGTIRYSLLRRPGQAARAGDGGWTQALPDDSVAAALDSLAR
jgi:3-dehydroquinate synthase